MRMADYKTYEIKEHYLLEINYEYYGGSKETIVDIWNWEVSIAIKDDVYKGMAIERNKNVLVPWITLSDQYYTDQMYKLCRERMNNN